MSLSPTGPGFLMRASTCAGRETSWERTCPGLDAVAGVLAQALQLLGHARSADGGKPDLSGSARAAFDWDGRGSGLDDNMALIALAVGPRVECW
jgi:hypothetical protein